VGAPAGVELLVPAFRKEIVAEMTHLARRSPHSSQTSGVSVRMSIGNYENLAANAIRRAARLGERRAVPRISDLAFLVPSTAGRVEIEALDDGPTATAIGDALAPGTIAAAVWDGHRYAQDLDDPAAADPDRIPYRREIIALPNE